MEPSKNTKDEKGLKRINLVYIVQEFLGIFNLEKGFFYTAKVLLLRPGSAIGTFIHTDRKRIMKPLLFLALCSAIFLLIIYWTGVKYSFLRVDGFSIFGNDYETGPLSSWLNDNLIYLNVLIALFVTVWIRIFFLDAKYNIYEVATAIFYIFGEGLLLLALMILIYKPLHEYMSGTLLWIPYVVYILYAIENFFIGKVPRWVNLIRVVIAFALGIFTYILFMALLAVLNTGV